MFDSLVAVAPVVLVADVASDGQRHLDGRLPEELFCFLIVVSITITVE